MYFTNLKVEKIKHSKGKASKHCTQLIHLANFQVALKKTKQNQ